MNVHSPIEETIWWSIVKQCDYATFFHTPLWHQLVTNTFPQYRNITYYVQLDSGVRVVLPLLEVKNVKGFLRSAVSTFAGCYGDLVADGHVAYQDRQQIYKHICTQQIGDLHITSNPITETKRLGGFQKEDDFTHLIVLDKDFDDLFAEFSKGHKSSFKRGKRMGVKVRLAISLDDYKAYFGAYEDSLRRWGDKASSHYPWHFFENGFYLSQKYPHNIKLWLAELEPQIIAGAWVFYWNQHAVWWHGSAFEAFFNYYPNNVLQTTIIRDACQQGYR